MVIKTLGVDEGYTKGWKEKGRSQAYGFTTARETGFRTCHFILFFPSVLHDTKAIGLSAVVLSFQITGLMSSHLSSILR